MEKIHRSEDVKWISKVVNLKEFCEKHSKGFESYFDQEDASLKAKFLEFFPNEEKTFADLEKKFTLSNLNCPYEGDIMLKKKFSIIPDGVELRTVKEQKKDVEKRCTNPRYREIFGNAKQLDNYPHCTGLVRESVTGDNVTLPDILLTVDIYRPMNAACTSECPENAFITQNSRVDQEFHVLGCQYLTELRDKIECTADMFIPGDFSENLDDVSLKPTCKELYKSGFFYINGTFYNDLRYKSCIDYSKTIIDWAKAPGRGLDAFKTKKMEETKFIDLKLQLGYPYVYIHQGNCEHHIVFKDLRMLNKDDSRIINNYPMPVRYVSKQRVVCMSCQYCTARWTVSGQLKLPVDPYLFCDKCIRSYCYTQDGQKIYDFTATLFIDRTGIF